MVTPAAELSCGSPARNGRDRLQQIYLHTTGITGSASPRTSQRLRAMLKPQAEPASPVGNPPLRDRRDHSHTRSSQNHRRRTNDKRSLRNLGCFLRLLCCWTNSGVHDASHDARSSGPTHAPRRCIRQHPLHWIGAQETQETQGKQRPR